MIGRKSSFFTKRDKKRGVCVSFAERLWQLQSGTRWRDTAVRVTKASKLTIHLAASNGQKKSVS